MHGIDEAHFNKHFIPSRTQNTTLLVKYFLYPLAKIPE